MSTPGDPRGGSHKDSQTPDELLAQTQSLLGEEGGAVEPSPTHQPESTKRAPKVSKDRGMSAGMWISLILGAAIVVLLLIFIVQNNVPANFEYFGWQFELPLGVAMLFAAIGGIFIAGIIGSVRIYVLSRKLKKINKTLGN